MASERGVTNGYQLLNMDSNEVVAQGTFCLSPLTRVTWAGFSSYNVSATADAAGHGGAAREQL